MTREFLKRRAETRKIEIHSPDAGLLEHLDALAHCQSNSRFNLFPIRSLGLVVGSRAADEKNGAVGRGLVFDVQAAFGFGIDRMANKATRDSSIRSGRLWRTSDQTTPAEDLQFKPVRRRRRADANHVLLPEVPAS